ncbi:zinc-binding dehydrogenase [Candidatus Woesearchaeota archaeon]|nr:zinc-binding dehydrogenase [Candidatus Woesearchaeota archaeon]
MKAVFFEKTGTVEVLQYGEFQKPEPKVGEAPVRVRACGINNLDVQQRQGKLEGPMPHIAGSDVAGVIEKINGKSLLKVGDEVVINPAILCGACPPCKKGLACELVIIFGYKTQGGYAEYVTVPIGQLYVKPKNLSFSDAAAFPLTFLTAWHMLVSRANLQNGETVFIWGASGGLGSAGMQIAKYMGAKIIAAAKSQEDAQRLKENGADETVIYTKEDVTASVNRLTTGRGVDVVFESVGAKTWNTSLMMLYPYGRVVIAGTTSGDTGTQDLSEVYYRQLSIFGARMGTKAEFEKVVELFKEGKLKPVVDKVFPLKDAAQAQRRLEESKHIGKIVLEI